MNNINQSKNEQINEEEIRRSAKEEAKNEFDNLEEEINTHSKNYGSFTTFNWDANTIYSKTGDNFLKLDEMRYEKLQDQFTEKRRDLCIPDYQRYYIWDTDMRSKFIESLLLGIPIPPAFLCKRGDNAFDIVDGYQRISTIVYFRENELILQNLELLKKFNGKRYSDLPISIQRKFDYAPFSVVVLDSIDSITEVFNRINSTGEKLEPAELRHALYQEGNFYKMVTDLAKNQDFRTICPLSEQKIKRREYEELIVRFFCYFEQYQSFNNKVASFLDEYVKKKNEAFNLNPNLSQQYQATFLEMVKFITKYFHTIAKNSKSATTPRIRFEALTVGVALALQQYTSANKTIPDKIDIDWIDSDDFRDLTTRDSSNTLKNITARINYVKDKIYFDSTKYFL
jgi:hypothetical protein